MSRVRARIEIDAPPEAVFDYFDDLANARVLIPMLVDIEKVEPLPNGGRHVEYTTRSESGIVPESSEHLEYERPRRTVTRGIRSNIETIATREFLPTPHGTLVVATVAIQVPVKYVGSLVSAPLRGPLRRSLRGSLRAVKDAIER